MPRDKELADLPETAVEEPETKAEKEIFITPPEAPETAYEAIVEGRSTVAAVDEHEDETEVELLRDEVNSSDDAELAGDDSATASSEETQVRSRSRSAANRRPGSAADLLTVELLERATATDDKLRSHLVGSVLFELQDSGEKYLFDWKGERPSCEKSEEEQAECVININSQNLFRIFDGDLNPQLAMLTDKIKVSGKASFAIYVFNLLSPKTTY